MIYDEEICSSSQKDRYRVTGYMHEEHRVRVASSCLLEAHVVPHSSKGLICSS